MSDITSVIIQILNCPDSEEPFVYSVMSGVTRVIFKCANIITRIAVTTVGLAAILVIMIVTINVNTFNTDVIIFIGKVIMCLTSQ